MFKKNDPLIDSVKSVMEQNRLERLAEETVNQEFGIHSKRALPHELHKQYDARLQEIIAEGKDIIAKQNGKPGIQSGDLAILRAKKKAGEPIAEASEEAKKEKVKKVMHHWKQGKQHIGKSEKTVPVSKKGQKQAVAIGLNMARKLKENIDINSVQEEIRAALQEKMKCVYESGDQAAMEAFVSSLSEEQIAILNLQELMGNAGNPFETGGSGPSIFSKIADKVKGTTGTGAASGADKAPSAITTPSSMSSSGAYQSAEKQKSTASHLSSPNTMGAAPSPAAAPDLSGGRQSVSTGKSVDKPGVTWAGGMKDGKPTGRLEPKIAAGSTFSGKNATAGSAKPTQAPVTSSIRRPMGGGRPRPAGGGASKMTSANQDFMTNLMREEKK